MIDRSNGPFGKYAFGLGVLAAGEELPRMPLLARLPRQALTEPFVAHEHAHPYLPLLVPSRHVSLLATALTVGIIALVAARMHSVLAALFAAAWGALHWLTPTFGADAIFDPLLACLVFATLPLVVRLSSRASSEGPGRAAHDARSWRPALAGPSLALGMTCAAAFQTRLNGGIALAAVLAVLAFQKQWKAALIVILAFAAATVAMNPFYWPNPAGRFTQEVSELRTTLAAVRPGGVRLPLWAADSPAREPIAWTAFQKLRFTWIALGGVLLVSAAAGCFVVRARRALLVWCAVVIGGILVWLPLPWARYFLVVLPPLALLAGIGCAGVLRGVFDACMWRMRQPPAERRHTNVRRDVALGFCTLNEITARSPCCCTRSASGTMFVFFVFAAKYSRNTAAMAALPSTRSAVAVGKNAVASSANASTTCTSSSAFSASSHARMAAPAS